MNLTFVFAAIYARVACLFQSVVITRLFVREHLQHPDPSTVGRLSEDVLVVLQHQALLTKRINAVVTLAAIAPVLLLALFRAATGEPLAGDPSSAGMNSDIGLALCLAALPLAMLFQLTVPLDGGALATSKLAPEEACQEPRPLISSTAAQAYRAAVRSRRGVRVLDLDCMQQLQAAQHGQAGARGAGAFA